MAGSSDTPYLTPLTGGAGGASDFNGPLTPLSVPGSRADRSSSVGAFFRAYLPSLLPQAAGVGGMEAGSSIVGGILGGAELGAEAGTVEPGLGNIVGGLAGGIVGGVAAAYGAEKAQNYALDNIPGLRSAVGLGSDQLQQDQ